VTFDAIRPASLNGLAEVGPARTGTVVTFGEAMIRLATPDHKRLEQATSLDVTIGGAELNVAAGVSRLGLAARWVSRIPQSPFGRMMLNRAREFGVDVSFVSSDPAARAGLYFLEAGASPRASAVLYDRAASAFSKITPDEIDWTAALVDASLLHTTGITPALSDSAAQAVRDAFAAARASGVPVSYDLNYRAKLWSEERARAVQEPLMADVDVLITTEEDTRRVFGITGSDYRDVARKLVDRFGFKVVTITLRGDTSVLRNTWTAIAHADGIDYDDRTYEIEIVDRVGGGDAYAAGFLYGWLTRGVGAGVRYGNAFSALQQTVPGDLAWVTLAEVEAQLSGAGLRIAR
jgi:2-dehydro-3-deoxygluconokinase